MTVSGLDLDRPVVLQLILDCVQYNIPKIIPAQRWQGFDLRQTPKAGTESFV